MKNEISLKSLRRIIREEIIKKSKLLVEECPSKLPCPVGMATELKSSGATPDELLDWVAKLTTELVSSVSKDDSTESESSLNPVFLEPNKDQDYDLDISDSLY